MSRPVQIPSPKPAIVDLFSGCGGFGLGAELAGFRTAVAIDIDETLQSAYRLNFPEAKAVIADVAQLNRAFWDKTLDGIRPDGLIGGPPCQGFSRIGKRLRDDPRNSLVWHFFRNVKILAPKFFVMENVDGLLDEGNVDALMCALQQVSKSYRVLDPVIVDASKYGAPTIRRRVIVAGYLKDAAPPFRECDLAPASGLRGPSVQDAISDLPAPIAEGVGDRFGWARYPKVDIDDSTVSPYAKQMRRLPPPGLGWRPALEKLVNGQISGLVNTIHSPAIASRFAETKPGKVEPISRYPRLAWEGHCPTLRAGTGSDRGSFQSMRPIHPQDPRVITVREAARLQGFPDWFAFHPTKWHSFRMIGNSVSPIVARSILSGIYDKQCN